MSPRRAKLLLGAIFAAALLLRLSAIHDKFLWFDEFLTANLARNSWGRIFGAVRAEAHPPLYFVVMKIWAAFFGDGRVALKTLSLLCGMASLGFLADAVRRVHGSEAALLAAALFGFSTVQIDQATDAKPYALLAFFVALQIWALVRSRDEPERRGYFVLAIAGAAGAASTHFYGTAAALALGLAAVLSAGDARERRRGAALLTVAGAAALVWLPPALRLPRGAADYIREIWRGVPVWAPLPVSTRISLPGWRKPYPPMDGRMLPGLSVREIAGAALILLLLIGGLRRRRSREPSAAGFLLGAGLLLFFGFLGLETAANFLDRPIGLPGRFEVVTELALALLAAGAVSGRVATRRILAVSLAAVGLWTVVPQWRPRSGAPPMRREDLIVRQIRSRLLPGGSAAIVTLGLARPPFDYYAAGEPRIGILSFPASQQDHPGWRESSISPEESRALPQEAQRLVTLLDDDLSRGVAVYVAARPDPRNGILLSRLRRDHELIPSPLADWFYALVPSPIRFARSGASSFHPVSRASADDRAGRATLSRPRSS
ncbi:MAG: glycosyltransferase family 39 protein [Thermoanaerobaculia bacterium]